MFKLTEERVYDQSNDHETNADGVLFYLFEFRPEQKQCKRRLSQNERGQTNILVVWQIVRDRLHKREHSYKSDPVQERRHLWNLYADICAQLIEYRPLTKVPQSVKSGFFKVHRNKKYYKHRHCRCHSSCETRH